MTITRRLFYTAELAVLMVLIKTRLTHRGFQRTAATCMKTRRRSVPMDETEVQEFLDTVVTLAQRVFRWHPAPNKCLEQALLLRSFLARRGIRSELIIAVRKNPFEAHAWTCWNDRALTDPPDRNPEHFRVIGRF